MEIATILFSILAPTIASIYCFKLALWSELSLLILALVISTVVSFFLLCRILKLDGSKRIWLAVLLGAMGPLAISLSKGYLVPMLMLALVGLWINLKKRNFLLASIYQSLFWLQPQLMFPLISFELGLGHFYTVIITFLMSVIWLLISLLIGGYGVIHKWYQLLSLQMYDWTGMLADCTLPGELLRFGLSKNYVSWLAIVGYSVLIVVAFVIGRRVKTKQWHLNILLTLVVPLSLILSWRASNNDLLLLFPGIVSLMLMPINNWLKYVRALLVMVSLTILFLPFYVLLDCYAIEKSVYNPFFWLTVSFATIAFVIEKYSSGQSSNADV